MTTGQDGGSCGPNCSCGGPRRDAFVALGPVRIRRRHAFLNGRRPRFLTRRKPGRLADLPVVVASERLVD